MTIIFKDSKIIAIDKELLNSLNLSLEEISNLIKEIELEILSLQKKELNLQKKIFNIEKKDLLTIENIKIFNLIPVNDFVDMPSVESIEKVEPYFTEPTELSNIEENLENEYIPIDIMPKNKPILSEDDLIGIENNEKFSIDIAEKNNFTPQIDLENNFKEDRSELDYETHEDKNLNVENNLEIEKAQENNEISISFEDEFAEVENMLNLSPEEAIEEINKELTQAANDLSIDIETIYDFKDELIEMIQKEKNSLFNAIKTENYEEIHKISHKLKGAALNLRLSNLALILKKIDELSKQKKDIHKIEYLTNKFYQFIEKIDKKESKKTKIPKEVKNLILKTIDDYLITQNEKKFKKDLKYIEKILNTKINSLEELQNILKD